MRKEKLGGDTYRYEIESSLAASRFRPGQFVIIRITEKGERIPLTIAGVDPQKGTVTLIVQALGKSTKDLAETNEGDAIEDCVGPLGNPSEIAKYGRVVCIGGGTGIACIFPIIEALADAGNEVISIIGARTGSLLFLEDEIGSLSKEIYVTTDDGSRGQRGFVTDALCTVLKRYDSGGIQRVMAIGPPLMMKAVADATRPYAVKTVVSLNTIMVDGTGMCGACRVYVDGEMKFACIDGPEFDAHKVNFEDLISRLTMFEKKEKIACTQCRQERKD
ncbi:MAG: sulfide/dihydroorotate dehydrogenase-like FAD/NAD-binding protein [candidate division WOR-3 bacterium]|nr:sulfide/dihydroorotate dehydrogenase-like FAD/NAD-binding protein [candidate division WOR-3 bacterium]